MPHKLKKSRKQRGSRYCGWGQVGQHRKGGMRGGKGKAGGRKHFWIRTVKYEPDRYKNIGFKPPSSLKPRADTINVGELMDIAVNVHGIEVIAAGTEGLILDLDSMGIQKLLGKGCIGAPFHVKVSGCSFRAQEKLKAAGGQIIGAE
ncbi:MAG: uL15 family ribosomal protein [Candidatus Bathyarchaeota archaeon]|nr:uL15 family ribosomal protein [Candidatus Bathyarchaeota archaeon]